MPVDLKNCYIKRILKLTEEDYFADGDFEARRDEIKSELSHLVKEYHEKISKCKIDKDINLMEERIRCLTSWLEGVDDINLDIDWESYASGPWGSDADEIEVDLIYQFDECASDAIKLECDFELDEKSLEKLRNKFYSFWVEHLDGNEDEKPPLSDSYLFFAKNSNEHELLRFYLDIADWAIKHDAYDMIPFSIRKRLEI